jgi:L-alanine-DL-glutamate epimerase-like enolase superfamily enzyme
MKIERVPCARSACRWCISSKPASAAPPSATSSWWKCRRTALSGWGEVTAGENPFYNEEWTESAWLMLRDYAAPRVLGRELAAPADVYPLTAHIRGHNMARGGLEAAVWDLEARMEGVPLWKAIGGGARARFPAASPSAFRIRSSSCSKRSSASWPPAISASR